MYYLSLDTQSTEQKNLFIRTLTIHIQTFLFWFTFNEALAGVLGIQGEGLFIFRDLGRRVIYFQGFGGESMVLGSREQGAEEKHFRVLGRKVIFLSGSREQRPPWGPLQWFCLTVLTWCCFALIIVSKGKHKLIYFDFRHSLVGFMSNISYALMRGCSSHPRRTNNFSL